MNQTNFISAPICRKRMGGAWWRRLVKSVLSVRRRTVRSLACVLSCSCLT